jgi:hypothetical protein
VEGGLEEVGEGGGGKCGVYVVDSYSVFFIYYIRTHKFSVTLVA